MKTTTLFSKIISIFCLLGLLAACAPAATSTPATTQAAVVPPASCETKFGLLLSLTGDLGDLGKAQLPAVDIALKEINDAGGVLGCKLTVQTEDDESTAEGAVKGANKLVLTDGAVSLLGLNSLDMVSLLDFARTNKVPIITHWGGTVKLDTEGGDYVYRDALSDSFAGVATAKFLIDQGYKTAANMYENSESPQSNAVTMKKAFEAAGGKVVADVAYNPGQASYQAELARYSRISRKSCSCLLVPTQPPPSCASGTAATTAASGS